MVTICYDYGAHSSQLVMTEKECALGGKRVRKTANQIDQRAACVLWSQKLNSELRFFVISAATYWGAGEKECMLQSNLPSLLISAGWPGVSETANLFNGICKPPPTNFR